MATSIDAMIDQIQRAAEDEEGTKYGYQQIADSINETVRNVTRMVAQRWPDCWLKTNETSEANFDLVDGQAAYDLPARTYQVFYVDYPDYNASRFYGSYPELDVRASQRDNAQGWYHKQESGTHKIIIFPTPDTDIAGQTVYVYVVTMPAKVEPQSGSDVPLSTFFGDLIKEFTLMKLKIQGKEDASGFQALTGYLRRQLEQFIATSNVSKDTGWELPKDDEQFI